MPPPYYKIGERIDLEHPANFYPTLKDLCKDKNLTSFDAGQYTVVDSGRNDDYHHDISAGDGYFYRLFYGGKHAGWQWQHILGILTVEENIRDENREIPTIEYENAPYSIGDNIVLPAAPVGWPKLNGFGNMDCSSFSKLTSTRFKVADVGALIHDGGVWDLESPVIENPLVIYLLSDAEGNELWTCKLFIEYAEQQLSPDEIIELTEQ